MTDYDPYLPKDLQRKEKEDARRLAREQEEEDLRWLMSTKQGRRVAHQILSMTGMFRSSYTGNSETFFREGMRNVGLILTNSLHTLTPSEYLLMLEEAQNARPSDERTR